MPNSGRHVLKPVVTVAVFFGGSGSVPATGAWFGPACAGQQAAERCGKAKRATAGGLDG